MSELGNLTARIFLPSGGMSTVEIRAGSLFCTTGSRIGAADAGFQTSGGHFWAGPMQSGFRRRVFLGPPQPRPMVHRMYTGSSAFALAGTEPSGAKSKEQQILAEGWR